MTTEKIPLNKLVPGKANVRKTGAKTGIDELAANIKALGLLQNLQVRPMEDGKYAVEAGRRRLFALKLLAKRKDIAKDEPIDCRVLAEGEDATEVSLAENLMRLPMHPADQFEAFKAMNDAGKGPEDIAARFGCAPSTVRQRMRLATVSPKLLAVYRDEGMTLDQLMAFTVSDDHEAQMTVWRELPQWNRDADAIRRNLTRAHVEADDDRAQFVGIETYLAAGGGIIRDLFAEAHAGYLTDPALLEKLAAGRLEREAESVRAEGWKWVEITPELDYAAFRGFGRVRPVIEPLSEEQQAELDRLTVAHDALVEQHGDDLPEDAAREMEALCEQIDALQGGTPRWIPEDRARAGAVIGIGHAGSLAVERGLVRPEDMPEREGRPEAAPQAGSGGKEGKPESNELSAALIEDLTAQRTAALRATLALDADTALAAVVHAMALDAFYPYGAESCLSLKARSAYLRQSAPGIEESPAGQAMAEHEERWRRQLPQDAEGLWQWCLAQDTATRLSLLAFCAATTVDAVRKPHEQAREQRFAHADELAAAVRLDMGLWWQPTKESYLARVSKARILEAVAEGVSQSAAENLAKLKKDALVKLAGERLEGTGWLPAVLRAPQPQGEAEPQPEAQAA
jgi:ParB family transcriptional regulator, chromosome partitioning protein